MRMTVYFTFIYIDSKTVMPIDERSFIMENLKEKCIDMLFDYIFNTYEYEICEDY